MSGDMDDLFRRLFEAFPAYVSVQDRDLRVIAANRQLCDDFGGQIGDRCYAVYKDRCEKCPVCPVVETFRDGRVHSSEELVIPHHGRPKHVIVYTAPLVTASGDIEAVVELSTDITRVKQLQEKLRMLFDEVPCYISVQGRDLHIQKANRRFVADFGDAIGQHCYRIYKHRTEPCLNCAVARTFADGQSHTSEEVVTAVGGEEVNVLCRTAPLRNEEGVIEAVMEMSTNITELRHAQSQVASLGLLVGSVAHGIKGLLSGLDGGIYLMETGFDKDKPERVVQGREMVKRNVDRIRAMVLNLLYFAKDRELYLQPLELCEIVASVSEIMIQRAELVGVSLEASAENETLTADTNALQSVLINLVENAIDACRIDKSKPSHTVSLRATREGDEVVFEIADDGIGMDQETQDRAFSLFFSSKGAEGTGLGLFIASKIVRAHGGTIAIDSVPGRGTRFSVRLPVAPPEPGAPPQVKLESSV